MSENKVPQSQWDFPDFHAFCFPLAMAMCGSIMRPGTQHQDSALGPQQRGGALHDGASFQGG